ncbi:MAG: carbohydrate binding domain-containing protein [Bacteroidota bacterium]|nr:carbohydrate binding domain-containing protein [Bacteroidota bacterium]
MKSPIKIPLLLIFLFSLFSVSAQTAFNKGVNLTNWFQTGSARQVQFARYTKEDFIRIKSLGLTVPAQKDYVSIAENKPFDIYTDFIGQSVFEPGYAGNGTIDYYSSGSQIGKYALYWTGSDRYAGPGFDLKPDKDLSILVANNYEFGFWVKGDSPGTQFQVRFVDSKSAVAGDHPWRISYTIDQSLVTWNGTWQHLKIPLKSFKETGSWDNGAWYNPEGKFEWKAVDRLEFISEFNQLGTQKIWFDDIRVNGTPITSTNEISDQQEFKAKAYPNPFTEGTTIEYDLPESGQVIVRISDLTGRELAVWTDSRLTQGRHQIYWNPRQNGFLKSADGVCVCKITSSGITEVLKLVFKN